ncbi:MAG: ABC transporter ATP-binding protein [Deltaproteobacteria bacterium]|nr:MAG: ABC transporter ATP-binding protein [Deltaproteobacteria bacterium]
MIQFQNVTKSFGTQVVLNHISFEIPAGKLTVILGPSGEGKSVLLKHIIGLMKPDEGKVIVDGVDLWSLSDKERTEFRKKFGMLFQSAALFDSMTVFENVAFPIREHTSLSEEEIKSKVLEKLKMVGLEKAIDKIPSELSGGMRKRVGLARAIALEPKILLYDEPTTGLDPLMTESINQLIYETQKKLNGQNSVTSVVISHDVESTFRVADLVVLLYRGQIIAEGRPDDFKNGKFTHPFVKEFLRGHFEKNI